MATTTSIQHITRDTVAQAVTDARSRTNDPRWLSAIAKAAVTLNGNQWLYDGHTLQIKGTRGTWYTVTPAACECIAYELGAPCYHRAAATLLHYAAMPQLASNAEQMVKVSPAEAAMDALNERATDADALAWREGVEGVDVPVTHGAFYHGEWLSAEHLERARQARAAFTDALNAEFGL